jgi:hypothetical protein
MSQASCKTRQCHESQVPENSQRMSQSDELVNGEHPEFDCFTALTAACSVCFQLWHPRPNPPVCLDRAGKRRESIDVIDRNGQGRAEGAPVEKRNATAGTTPFEPIFILTLPRSLSIEPRLHAHGKTVRNHSVGDTDTSGRQSSEKAQTQHLHTDGKVREDKNCVDCVKRTIVPAWLLHPQKLFVDSSTADDRVRMGPGVFSTPPPTTGLAFSIGKMKTQNVQTRRCAEQGRQVSATAATSPQVHGDPC